MGNIINLFVTNISWISGALKMKKGSEFGYIEMKVELFFCTTM